MLIKEKGYTVTGDKIGDPHAKYIKFTAPGQERPVRGSFRNFGAGYTKEEIKGRIENPEKWQNKEQLNKTISKDQESSIFNVYNVFHYFTLDINTMHSATLVPITFFASMQIIFNNCL